MLNTLSIDASDYLQCLPWTRPRWRFFDRAYEMRERSSISVKARYLSHYSMMMPTLYLSMTMSSMAGMLCPCSFASGGWRTVDEADFGFKYG
jgi:hypothetical protein